MVGRRAFIVGIGLLASIALRWEPAHAQLLEQLKGAVGGSDQGSSGGLLGGLGAGVPSVDRASPSNIGGVLQYCIKNNYLGGNSASSVKDSLVSKLSGNGRGANDGEYRSGSNGLLETGNGQAYSLGGGGVKAQVTHKVCDLVLQHAKSLL